MENRMLGAWKREVPDPADSAFRKINPTLYIIRGLPGSGKTTLAKELAEFRNAVHFETDMYFEKSGIYEFDASKLKLAHAWCLEAVKTHLKMDYDVVVSNTFTQIWEMQPYIDLGYPIVVIKCENKFNSIHEVPLHTIEKMKARWEDF